MPPKKNRLIIIKKGTIKEAPKPKTSLEYVKNLEHPVFTSVERTPTTFGISFDGRAKAEFAKSKPLQDLLKNTQAKMDKLNKIDVSKLSVKQLRNLKIAVTKLIDVAKYVKDYTNIDVFSLENRYLNKILEQEKINQANLNEKNTRTHTSSEKKAMSNLTEQELREMTRLQKELADKEGNLRVIITDFRVMKELYSVYKKKEYSVFLEALFLYKKKYVGRENKYLQDMKVINEYLKVLPEH